MLNMRPLKEPAISLLCCQCHQLLRSGQHSFVTGTLGFDKWRLGGEGGVRSVDRRTGASFLS
jgi:hypothetical protein